MRERLKRAWLAFRTPTFRLVDVDCFNFDRPPHIKGKPAARASLLDQEHYAFVLDGGQPSIRLEFARGRAIEVSIRL